MNLDALKELHHKKGREAQHRYLLEGEHLVLELQRAAEHDPRLRAAEIYITHERGVWPSALSTHTGILGTLLLRMLVPMSHAHLQQHPRPLPPPLPLPLEPRWLPG